MEWTDRLNEVDAAFEEIEAAILDQQPCQAFTSGRLDLARREFTLAGNREGLLLLASHLVSLAKAASPGHHVHFDKHSNLDEADGKLVIAYEPAPWEDRSTSTSTFPWGQSVRVRADADVEPQSRRGARASICGIRPSAHGGETIYLIEFSDGAAIELSESQLEPLP